MFVVAGSFVFVLANFDLVRMVGLMLSFGQLVHSLLYLVYLCHQQLYRPFSVLNCAALTIHLLVFLNIQTHLITLLLQLVALLV